MSLVNFSGQNVAEFTITGFDNVPHQKVLGFIILLTYSLVLLCSATNICVISTDRRLHRPMYLLICNLAVVDMMFTTSASTIMISVLLAEDKTVSYYSCISHVFFYHLGDITECLALSLMALDRTLAISYPLRYTSILTNTRIFMLIILSWFTGFAWMGKLTEVVGSLPYCQPIIRYVFCDYPAMIRASCVNPEPYFQLPTILCLWLYAVQCPLILLSYMKIVYTVLRLPNNENRAQVFNTVFCHLITVASFYCPKMVHALITRIGLKLTLTQRNGMLISSTLLPSLINPTVYCLRMKEIRNRLLLIVSRKGVASLK